MFKLPSRTSSAFLLLIVLSILINLPINDDVIQDNYIDKIDYLLLMLFTLLLIIIGPIYIKGHQGYDHIEDLYSQAEAERVYTVSRTNPIS